MLPKNNYLSSTSSLGSRKFDKISTDMPTIAQNNVPGAIQNGTKPTSNGISDYQERDSSPPMVFNGKSNSTVRELHGYVGFANIPNQVYRKAIKQGFDFSLMVVGQSGLGKSTFINSLFLTDVYPPVRSESLRSPPQTVAVEEQTVRLVESGVNLLLNLIDTPGFGDSVDNSKCWDPIIQFVDKKYGQFFTEETKVQRKERIPDHRVHCCLYFIAPSGHGLKQLDIEFMKQLHDRVNIIPVIAKADTMTPEELKRFKQAILNEIRAQKIKVYDFPDPEDEADEEAKQMQHSLKERVPFAVVGSNHIADVDGVKKRCRKYPWGIVEVENLEHNDYKALRDMIIRTHMIDMLDVTRSVHYENFRARQLMTNGGVRDAAGKDPFTQMQDEKSEHEFKIKKQQEEMEKVFQQKVAEKEQKLKEQEREYELTAEQFHSEIEKRRALLETKKKALLDFKTQHPQLATYDSKDSLHSRGSSDVSPDQKGKKWKLGTFGKS